MSPTKATKKPSPAGAPTTSDKKPVASAKPGTGPVGAKTDSANGPAGSKAGPAPNRGNHRTGSGPTDHKTGAATSPADPKAGAKAGAKGSGKPSSSAQQPLTTAAADAAPLASAADAKADPKRDKPPSAAQTLASELIASADTQAVLRHAAALEDERENAANQAARLIQELAETKPELIVPLIERFARLVASKNRRVVATCAAALAPLSRIAPAKVAKQLPVLTHNWEHTTEEGKDGLVRTFAGLCTASVAYQKRLEPALARALGEAEPKLLIRWTEIVLPALKGEPHARARAVVEERLPAIPRPQAQKIADFLGIKLRPLPR